MTLRDILSIELSSPARIRIDAQCEENYYFYIDIDEDSREDPLESLSDDILDSNVKGIVAYWGELFIDVDISMVYIDRNGGENDD